MLPSPQESTDAAGLVEALVRSNNVLEFVPRKVLIDTLGPELADRFLMELPKFVSVNVDQVLLTIRAFKPELLPASPEPSIVPPPS